MWLVEAGDLTEGNNIFLVLSLLYFIYLFFFLRGWLGRWFPAKPSFKHDQYDRQCII